MEDLAAHEVISPDIKMATTPDSWPIENIRPYEGNAKIHTDDQINGIAKSIKTYGMDQPIVVDGSGVIIKGHGRWMAAKKLGLKFVPVIVRTDLTANQANASRVADNIVARGDHDTDKLQKEIRDLAASSEIELDSLGLSDKELEFLTNDLGEMDESAVMGEINAEDSNISSVLNDAAKLETVEVPIARVLGFTKIPGSAATTIASFMTSIEAETQKRGAEAFVAWIESIFARAEASPEEAVTGD